MFGLEDLTSEKRTDASISEFMLILLQISIQSKIIHWQARTNREHTHYGEFFDEFNEHMDALIEAIAGKYGKDSIKFKEAAIMVYDYDMAVSEFFKLVEETFKIRFCEIFDRDNDSELYNLNDEVMTLTNKTKYLLQFEA